MIKPRWVEIILAIDNEKGMTKHEVSMISGTTWSHACNILTDLKEQGLVTIRKVQKKTHYKVLLTEKGIEAQRNAKLLYGEENEKLQ